MIFEFVGSENITEIVVVPAVVRRAYEGYSKLFERGTAVERARAQISKRASVAEGGGSQSGTAVERVAFYCRKFL